ncbi:OmpA family protein [bacterium]|nr:OmpA family protein [bacterium]MBU1434908.1 OmpA family protein [bacterium]MBU1504013.1 OmpA family protein [bacterium]
MKLILLFLLILSAIEAKNPDYSVIIDKPFNDALHDITQNYDRSLSAVGFSNNYNTPTKNSDEVYTDPFEYLASVSQGQGQQIHLVTVDDGGNIVLSKATSLPDFNEAVSLLKTPSNGYFVGGHTLGGSLIFLKLDANANIIFTKTFGTQKYDKMSKLIALGDGGALAIGSSASSGTSNDSIFTSGLGLSDIYITRFSKDGEMLWNKKYGTVYDDKGVDAVEANDGSLIVTGTSAHEGSNNLLLLRLGENGDKIWLKEYESKLLLSPHKLIQLQEGNFLLSLTQSDSLRKEQIRLIKFDLQKNILLDKLIPTTYSSGLKDIAEFSDSSIIGVGYVNDAGNTDALVMLFDPSLNMKTQEHYGQKNFDIFNAAEILHNSQVGVAGIHTSGTSQESNMWIAKLNKNGTMAQFAPSNLIIPKEQKASKSTGTLYENLKKIFQEEIAAKKITIQSDLTIELIDSSLLFKVGVYELTNAQKSFLDTFSPKLVKFLQEQQKNIEGLAVNGHTSSEWGGVKFTQRYLKNEKLSLERSYSVLSYLFKKQNESTQKWLSKILVGSGYSFSKKVTYDEKEDFEKSRRVAFKVLVK